MYSAFNGKGFLRRGDVMSFDELRKKKGYTQQFLAEKLNVKQSTVAMWETGKSVPTMKNMIAISEILNVDVSVLFKSFPKSRKINEERRWIAKKDKKGTIEALTDIIKCLRSELPVDNFIMNWVRWSIDFNPDAEKVTREMYAQYLEYAKEVIESLEENEQDSQ